MKENNDDYKKMCAICDVCHTTFKCNNGGAKYCPDCRKSEGEKVGKEYYLRTRVLKERVCMDCNKTYNPKGRDRKCSDCRLIDESKKRVRHFGSYPCIICKSFFRHTGPNCLYCEQCKEKLKFESLEKVRQLTKEKNLVRNQTGKNNGNYKHGKNIDYVKLAFDNLPNYCNRCKDVKFMTVHHKDRSHDNHDIDNLEILCRRCHQLEHDCTSNLPQYKE